MVKAELGTKRTCPSCAARFYDLMRNPIVCPKCNANFVAASVLPSKGDMPAMAPAPKPRVVEVADDVIEPIPLALRQTRDGVQRAKVERLRHRPLTEREHARVEELLRAILKELKKVNRKQKGTK